MALAVRRRGKLIVLDLGDAADRLLAPTFARAGLVVDGCSKWSVTFRDVRRIVELSYYREDPTPRLGVVLGLRQSEAELRVALWRLYPEAGELTSRDALVFTTSDGLDVALLSVRDSWLDRYVWPAFEQPERFRTAWLVQQRETDEHYEANVRHGLLTRARRAYERGDLERAVNQYARAGIDTLSAADRRRYVLARRGTA